MDAPTKMEFDVEMTCQNCVSAVQKSLGGVQGVHSVEINLKTGQVIVAGTLTSTAVLNLIETSGRRAVLKGMGHTRGDVPHLGAAVSIMDTGSYKKVRGLIRMVQTDEQNCLIEGSVDGLTPGHHALCLHECGDISDGCNSCGDMFMQDSESKSPGEMGDILAGPNGRAEFRLLNDKIKIWDMIGRSMIIHSCATNQVQADTANDKRLVCGIIARSAGLFQNPKNFCACDGISQWDERNVPLAGSGRQAKM